MCFTVNVNIVKEEMESRYGSNLLDPEKYIPSYYYHAFSFPDLPSLILNNQGDKVLRTLKWGLIPAWTNSDEEANKIRTMTPNARSETAAKKPSFSESFRERRCIIPISGFYEWQHLNSGKRPWYIYNRNQKIISLAGIYDIWDSGKAEGDISDKLYTFSILTCNANSMMAEIHNKKKRMPVIIPSGSEDEWLGGDIDSIQHLLAPAPEETLSAHTINPAAGNPRIDKNRPETIEPYIFPEEPTLF